MAKLAEGTCPPPDAKPWALPAIQKQVCVLNLITEQTFCDRTNPNNLDEYKTFNFMPLPKQAC